MVSWLKRGVNDLNVVYLMLLYWYLIVSCLSRLVQLFWCCLTQFFLEKRLLSRCLCLSVCLSVEHIIEIDSKSAMTSLHSSVMEETGRLGVDVFVDNGGIVCNIDISNVCGNSEFNLLLTCSRRIKWAHMRHQTKQCTLFKDVIFSTLILLIVSWHQFGSTIT